MNFFESDSEEDISKTGFYEKDPVQVEMSQVYHNKFMNFLNEYTDKLNLFEERELVSNLNNPKEAIHLSFRNYEQNLNIQELIQNDNKIIEKIISSFTILDDQIEKISEKLKSSLFNSILMYGEVPETKKPISEIQISKALDILKQIYELMKKLITIIFNLINQIHWIYNKHDLLYKSLIKGQLLFKPLDSIGKGLCLVLTLDKLVKENEELRNDWNNYKKMLKIIKTDIQKYNIKEDELKRLEHGLIRIEKTILSGHCLITFCTQNFDNPIIIDLYKEKNKTGLIKDNKELYNLFYLYLKNNVNEILERLSSPLEIFERNKLGQLLSFYCLFRKLWPKEEDRKIWKSLWKTQKKTPIIILHGHVSLFIGEYMLEIVPLTKKSSRKRPKNEKENIRKYLSRLDISFETDIHTLYIHFTSLISKEICLSNNLVDKKDVKNIDENLNYKAKFILSALLFSSQIRLKILNFVILHFTQKTELPRSLIRSILLGISMLISIKKIVNSKFQYLSIELITRYITNQIIEIISARKKSSKKQQNPNKLALFQLIPRLLKGSGSSVRNTGLSLCFDLLRDLFKDEEYEDLKYLLWKYEILNNYKSILEELTDCSFLYGLSDLYPSFFEFSYKNLNKFSFLIDILDGLEDVRFLIHQGIDPINNENLDQELQNSIINLFKTTILKPLTNDIEDFLRINVHSILIDKIKTPNILKTELKLVKESLNKGNINIFGYKVNIGNEIISKLNEVFYNINALNPFDYETYELIRQLAYEEFGLKMASVHIPSQTIEQGNVDLVNLMKNLSFFVNKYAYHLLENTFLEIPKKNEGKMLLSIGIQQIADSIKTHGLGIINTFVNENYKFLTKKFNILSQFMYDEMVQSILIREELFFQNNKLKLNGYYPFENGEKLYKEMIRLGQFEDLTNYIDKLRVLLTQIGNVLGFARLIKSSCLRFCSNQIEYLSPNAENLNFNDIIQNSSFSDSSVDVTKELSNLLNDYNEHFTAQTDYLRMFGKMFEKEAKEQSQKHLKLFHYLIPVLLMNFVEKMLIFKDRLAKKQVDDVLLADDGFIIGIAYVLHSLELDQAYNSLHWEETILKKFDDSLKSNSIREKSKTSSSKRQAEEINLQKDLSLRKTNLLLEEYQIIFHNLKSARILFK